MKQVKVKLPSGKFVPVKHINEFTWGELEDLEALQEQLVDEENSKVLSTIRKFLSLLVPKLEDKDRRAFTKEQMNDFISSVWDASQKSANVKEDEAKDAEEGIDGGKA